MLSSTDCMRERGEGRKGLKKGRADVHCILKAFGWYKNSSLGSLFEQLQDLSAKKESLIVRGK